MTDGAVTDGAAADSAPARWQRWLPPGVLAVAVAIDLAYGDTASVVVPVVFASFTAAAFDTVRRTTTLACGAVVAAFLLGWPDGIAGTSEHAVTVLAVAAGGGLSVWLARERTRADQRLLAVTRVADTAQLAILHPLPARAGGARVAGRYVSADSEARVGGDFYEVAETPFGLRLVVGDVRGKGLDAVRLAAVLVGEFRARAHTDEHLEAIVTSVDRAGARHVETTEGDEDFATAVFAELRDGVLRLVLRGHPPPLLARAGAVEPVSAPASLPLCFGDEAVSATHPVRPGDRVVFFSDGAFEGRDDGGRQFDLAAAVRAECGRDLDGMLASVFSSLESHCAGGLDDDVVIVAIEVEPPA